MRVSELIIVSCILASSGSGAAFAQFVDPLRVLDEARRDRLESETRFARDAAAQRQPSSPRAPIPAAPSASGTADSNQPAAPSTLGETALSPSSTEPARGMPLSNERGAPLGQKEIPGGPPPTAPAASAGSDITAPSQPV